MLTENRPAAPGALHVAEDSRMYREAASAPSRVALQLQTSRDVIARISRRLRARRPALVLTCARGSSDHAATYAKYLIETRIGTPVMSYAPSVSSLYQHSLAVEDALCLAISQSGASPDILSAVRRAREGGAFTVAMTNNTDSPLAAIADEVVPLCAGRETSVAATKSYIASLAAIASLVAGWSEDSVMRHRLDALPAALAQAWELDWSAALEHLIPCNSMYVVGRGIGLGIAQEAALKFKECCALHAECFSAAELIHGPMALVSPGFPVLLFAQNDEAMASVQAVADRCRMQGATALLVAPGQASALPALVNHPALEPVLQVQSFYRMVAVLACARGRNPDKPPHLQKVTETL